MLITLPIALSYWLNEQTYNDVMIKFVLLVVSCNEIMQTIYFTFILIFFILKKNMSNWEFQ